MNFFEKFQKLARYKIAFKSKFGISELHMVWFRIKAVKLLQQVVANALLLFMLYGLFQSVRISDPDRDSSLVETVQFVPQKKAEFQSAGPGPVMRKELKEALHSRFQLGRVQFRWDTETGFDALYLFYTLVAYFFVYTIKSKLSEPG